MNTEQTTENIFTYKFCTTMKEKSYSLSTTCKFSSKCMFVWTSYGSQTSLPKQKTRDKKTCIVWKPVSPQTQGPKVEITYSWHTYCAHSIFVGTWNIDSQL